MPDLRPIHAVVDALCATTVWTSERRGRWLLMLERAKPVPE